jgi:Protein of unknown function (DUF1460)
MLEAMAGMLEAMTGSVLERRAFVALLSRALVAAGALAMARPNPASGRDRDPNVFTGQETFEQLLTVARELGWHELSIGHRVGALGMALRQTPYVPATLELYEDREVCSVNLRGLDCVTFFESALALARMLRRGGRTPEALLAEVTVMRYRGGQLTDYASRLHYMSDWFFDNQQKGVVRVITRDLPGATRLAKRLNFMSTHPEAYRPLKANPDLVRKIARIEGQITAREMEYVPKEKVPTAQPLLMTGDIVGITTAIEGLDCSHAGFCYRAEGVLRLLHASTTQNAVILDEDLAAYLARVSTHTGIMVARPLEVT